MRDSEPVMDLKEGCAGCGTDLPVWPEIEMGVDIEHPDHVVRIGIEEPGRMRERNLMPSPRPME